MNLLLLGLPFLLSLFISRLYPMDQVWYQTLDQSPYTPPPQTFGYVWFILYLLIGWGLGQPNPEWLVFNLMLNLLWIIIFSGYKNINSGFWILILMNLSLVMYLSRTQNWLLLPYLAWSLIALYLNWYLMNNNQGHLNNNNQGHLSNKEI